MGAAISWVAGLSSLAILVPDWFRNEFEDNISVPEYFMRIRDTVTWTPPPWIFGPVWFILYLFMSVTIGLWVDSRIGAEGSAAYTATWILIVLNYIFNKSWQPIFFDYRQPVLAAIDAFLIFATAVAVFALLFVEGHASAGEITAYILWGIYMLWTLFAFILSTAVAIRRENLVRGRMGTKDFNVDNI